MNELAQIIRKLNIKRKLITYRLLGHENKSCFEKFFGLDKRKAISRELEAKSNINPWAFIRASNEERTLETSLYSAGKAFNRGIIVYNSCIDSTESLIKEFCNKHSGFICVEYPFDLIPAGSLELLKNKNQIPYHNTLAAYYNFALGLIPKGDWLCKIDCDHFYFPEVLEFAFSLATSENDIIWLPRVDCYIDYSERTPKVYGSETHIGSDHWVVKNDDLYFENIAYTDETGYHAFETLRWKKPRIAKSVECASIHFPYEKTSRRHIKPKNILPWEEYTKKLPKNFLTKDYATSDSIIDIIKHFKQ